MIGGITSKDVRYSTFLVPAMYQLRAIGMEYDLPKGVFNDFVRFTLRFSRNTQKAKLRFKYSIGVEYE